MKRTILLLVLVIIILASPSMAGELATTYQLKSTDFGDYVNGLWDWNDNFFPVAKLFVDSDGKLNATSGELIAQWNWENTIDPENGYVWVAVTPIVQPWAFQWTEGVEVNLQGAGGVRIEKRKYEDSSLDHTRLVFTAAERRAVPDCRWVYENKMWNFGCVETRPAGCEFCIFCGINEDGTPNGNDFECGNPPIELPEECQGVCANLSIQAISESSTPIDTSGMSVQVFDEADREVMSGAGSEIILENSERIAVNYNYPPGFWSQATDWVNEPQYRLESDFVPESGKEYTVKISIDETDYHFTVGPGNFDVAVPLVCSVTETPFTSLTGKETRKTVSVNNITAFERDNGELVIQWGEPILDPTFPGGRIELRPIIRAGNSYIFLQAPPQAGTVNVPESAWTALKDKGVDAGVSIMYRAISGENARGTPDYSRCEVRAISDTVPVQ